MAAAKSSDLGARHTGIRHALGTLSLDALIVTNATNIRYLTNHAGSAGTLVATAGAMHLLVDFRYQEAVRLLQASVSACPTLKVWPVPASYDEALLNCLAEIAVSTIGFEAAHLSVARHEWLQRTAAGRRMAVTFRPTERVVEPARQTSPTTCELFTVTR